jgi:multidrug efflux pump subunit AcrA (membrane-fusion protein)
MVANCTLRAPRDGLIVYSMGSSGGWRPPAVVIQEGATVREGQAIIDLPDPKHMRVKAKINESKVNSIHKGQRASIRIDAFPNLQLAGTVDEITVIPAPANGPSSDVKIYVANVTIDSGGFADLRPGLSAEVTFLGDVRDKVTRVPVDAIRWVGDVPFVALSKPGGYDASWEWRQVELGLMNQTYAEVLGGLQAGDKVVSSPLGLPEPVLEAKRPMQAAGKVVPSAG